MLVNKRKISQQKIVQLEAIFQVIERRGLSRKIFLRKHIEPKLILKSMKENDDTKLEASIKARIFTREILKQV